MNNRSCIKIIAPIGELPGPDPDLVKRIQQLPKDSPHPVSDVFKAVSEWEPGAVKRFREMEKTKKSGRLHPICPLGGK